ncbi:MAG: excinuclease ABC subunit A [Flavobacteriales bacterium]
MSSRSHIEIYGANQHNLKSVDVQIPKNKLVVITGLSGSGKTSLAFDTLYAEGQRRYVESLSSYARQFLGRIDKPDVKEIKGLTPSIAIEQKVISTNSRSTVGTSTEIYDYLKLLYARIGKTISPISGNPVKKHRVSDVLEFISTLESGHKLLLLAKIPKEKTEEHYKKILLNQGYSRLYVNNELIDIEDWKLETDSFLVIDRFKLKKEEQSAMNRLGESIELAFFEGEGELSLKSLDEDWTKQYNNRFELDGLKFIEPNVNLFSFNSPVGSCPTCQGYGKTIGLDPELVCPNPKKSIYEGAILFSKYQGVELWKKALFTFCKAQDISIHKPYSELSQVEQDKLWAGGKSFSGISGYFKKLESESHKIQSRVMLSRFRGKTDCWDCKGKRLRKEALYVKVADKDISELMQLPLDELFNFFSTVKLDEKSMHVAKRLMFEITNRLSLLLKVGLPYLDLNRKSNTLSGGESQRIRLACALSSSLVSSTYVLDEPSIGLHARDTQRLIEVLKGLRDLGNTVVVVEHDEDIMQAADHIIDMGKEAGVAGGHVVFSGNYKDLLKEKDSYTAQYLNQNLQLERHFEPLTFKNTIELKGARCNNLKGIDISLPINNLTVISGMSGSGKSTLIKSVLYPAIQRKFGSATKQEGFFESLNFEMRMSQKLFISSV